MQININALLSLNADNLSQIQHNMLKEHVLSVLNNIQTLIEEEKYDEVINYVFENEDEDDEGVLHTSVCAINFSYNDGYDDIIDITNYLTHLKTLANKKNKYI